MKDLKELEEENEKLEEELSVIQKEIDEIRSKLEKLLNYSTLHLNPIYYKPVII